MSPRPKTLRAAKWIAIVAIGIAALYLVGMNVFLRTRIFRNAINFDPETLTVEYASAYSLFPGRIHVERLTIRSSDSAVEWILAIDRCDFRVSFTELLQRRFHAYHVRGDGVSFRGRLRLAREDATPEVASELPPIPGFSDPPLLSRDVPPDLADALYNLWSADLEDVDAANVREVWVQSTRFTGDMHVRGRFYLRPLRWLEVGPARVEAHGVTLSVGRRVITSNVDGVLDTTVHPFDVRRPKGLEVFAYVSLDGELKGELATADVIAMAQIDAVHVAADRRDPFEARVRLDEGFLREGTHFDTRTHFRARVGPTALTGDARVHVAAETHAHDGGVDVSGSTLALDDVATEEEPKTRGWWAKIALRDATLWNSRAPRSHEFVDVSARDAEPGVAIVAGNTGVPPWAAKVFGMHDLQAHAEVRTGPQTLDVLSAEVKGNDAASIRADYVKRFGATNGAVLVTLGPLAMGVKLGDEAATPGGKLELLGATSWFERESAWLRVRAER